MSIPIEIIEFAETLAAKSSMKQKMSAVIFRGNKILSSDYNRWVRYSTIGNSTRACVYGVPVFSVHAEISAIRKFYRHYGSKGFIGSSIYVHRLGSRNAKPCSHCMQVVLMMGISNIYWSNENGINQLFL
jgi:tRNA(Arg) A34 adenosine deaminase TadA